MAPAIHIELYRRRTGVYDDFPLPGAIHRSVQVVVQVAKFISSEHDRTMIPRHPPFHEMVWGAITTLGSMLRHHHFTPGPIGSRPHCDLSALPCRVAHNRPFDPLPAV